MRELLFRGMTGGGKWLYGSLINDFDVPAIRFTKSVKVEAVLVKKHTVGQFTGLLDKNGKKIFESDIIDVSGIKYSVIFDNGAFQIHDPEAHSGRNPLCAERCRFITVTGNIHEDKI